MTSITLQELCKSANAYQQSKESQPEVLTGILEEFENSLRIIAETATPNIKVKLESQADRLIMTRARMVELGVGQLAFWDQMVRIEELAQSCLQNQTNGNLIPPLKEFYHLFFSRLKHMKRIAPTETMKVLETKSESIAEIQKLVNLLPEEAELRSDWEQILKEETINPTFAINKLNHLILELNHYDSDADSENLSDEQIDSPHSLSLDDFWELTSSPRSSNWTSDVPD